MVLVPHRPWHRFSLRERLAAVVARRWGQVRAQVTAWRRQPAKELHQLYDRSRAAVALLVRGRRHRDGPRRHL
jgi:hypothetical protein